MASRVILVSAPILLMCARGFSVEVSPHKLTSIPITQVAITDEFWSPRLKTLRDVTLPDVLKKFETDRGGAFNNFDLVREGKLGKHAGPQWFDGLFYETLRAASDIMAVHYDEKLDKRLDGYIARIAAAAAKDPDGYVNTWTQLMAPETRWGFNGGLLLEQHDVYNAGMLVDAAVHHFRATGKTSLLSVAVKFANHMCDIMGPSPKKNIVPAHSGPEEALVKLYLLFRDNPDTKNKLPVPVNEEGYLKLAEFWIENRGRHVGKPDWDNEDWSKCVDYVRSQAYGEGRPSWGAYAQDHKPVLQQETIEGHAVRATLLCTGLIAAANMNNRDLYFRTAVRLWENMVYRRMHITGGVGAVHHMERFGPDYFLPNDAYLETCAAVGAGFFHQHMNTAFADARYADELERVLFNSVLSGVSLKGDTFFYQNPLEGSGRQRWQWDPCPCCPPMLLKILTAMPGFIYAYDADGIYLNLYVGSQATIQMNGQEVRILQRTRYPWDGAVTVTVEPGQPATFNVNLRIPGWCDGATLAVNGEAVDDPPMYSGYACIRRRWRSGDQVRLDIPMPTRRIKAHPRVEADRGRVALMRGPIVYCLEGLDNGGRVRYLSLPRDTELIAEHRPDMLGGVTVIQGFALLRSMSDWSRCLYRAVDELPEEKLVEFVAVPYWANSNRGPTDMVVWIPETPDLADPMPVPTIASQARPSASHCWQYDTLTALNDQIEPRTSDDTDIPRFTWWDHRGTKEWAQYDFDRLYKVSSIEIYWWDERRIKAHCRVPQSWGLSYRAARTWKPVTGASEYGTSMDQYNRVTFDPVETDGLRIEVQLLPDWSGGILEWRVE